MTLRRLRPTCPDFESTKSLNPPVEHFVGTSEVNSEDVLPRYIPRSFPTNWWSSEFLRKFVSSEFRRKRKNPIKEKLYWGDLFGSLKNCTVDLAIEMLKKRKVKDRQSRLKYACLAITSFVLLPTSHFPRILPNHVEMIRDLDEFMAYPWGRVAFEMLVQGIRSKDEILLSQASVAMRGFVDAIQLVFVAAVPQLKEVVPNNEPAVLVESDSESENGSQETGRPQVNPQELATPQKPIRYCVNPGHARELDEGCQVEVISMLQEPTMGETDFGWDDEVEDDLVDNMVRLIEEKHIFKKSMFVGGTTASDLSRMKLEKKQKDNEAKEKKEREPQVDPTEPEVVEAVNTNHLAQMVGDIVNQKIENLADRISQQGDKIEERLVKAIEEQRLKMQGEVIESILDFLRKSNSNVVFGEQLHCEGPQFGKDASQEKFNDNTSPPWPPIAILTKIPNQPVGNEDAAVARKKMVNNMVEEEGLRNITAHGTTTSPLTKHVDESSGDNPEEMQVRNDYEVTLPPLCMEAMDSTTQFSRTRTAVVAIT
ncbi:unnamed protein product [Brassica oleracea var. botrytis]